MLTTQTQIQNLYLLQQIENNFTDNFYVSLSEVTSSEPPEVR